jgi:ferredoxin/coenzyme F420-reducing hydrogenase delta subunit
VEGEDLDGVLKGVDFLQDVALGRSVSLGRRVVVIGGGNVAIDVARSALRVGAQEVSMVCLEKQEEMPASDSEIKDAREEGIAILNCYGPKRFLEENGKLSGIEFKLCTCLFDEKGVFCPSYDETQLTEMKADNVIVAIGQAADLSFIKMDNLAVTKRGGLEVDPLTLQMPTPGVFAGGDAVTGPATAIKAIAAGKKAAVSIDLYLRGESLPTVKQLEAPETRRLPEHIIEKARFISRCKERTLSAENRLSGFDEVMSVFTEREAVQEAQRCLHCNLGAKINHELCIGCGTCAKVCPLEIPSLDRDGRADIDIFQCQACGTCVAECPVQAINIILCPRGHIICEVEKRLRKLQIDSPFTVGLFSQYGNFTTDHLDALGRDFPQVMPVMIFGMERVSISDLLRTFQLGADGILMAEAPEEKQIFSQTRSLIENRSKIAKEILNLLSLGEERLILYTMPNEGLFEESWLAHIMEEIRAMGPNPLRKDSVMS